MRSSDSETDEDDSFGTEPYYGNKINALRSLLEDVGNSGKCQSWSAGFCTFADRRLSSDHPCRSLRFRTNRKARKRARSPLD